MNIFRRIILANPLWLRVLATATAPLWAPAVILYSAVNELLSDIRDKIEYEEYLRQWNKKDNK